MEFEYGTIEAIEESDGKPYIKLTIKQNVAYGIKYRKFNVFNVKHLQKQMGYALKKDTEVKFTTIKSGEFYNLATLEKSELSKCFGCDAYTPFRNKQQMECEQCFGRIAKLKIDKELKLVKKTIVEYQYSSGITLTFIDEKEECLTNHLYISNTFENKNNFKRLSELKEGEKKRICGWISEEHGHYSFFDITDIAEIEESV